MMVLHIELYLFITLSVTLTLFEGHSNVKQFWLNILHSYPIKLKLCRTVKYIAQVMNISLFLTFTHIQGREVMCFLIWQELLSLALSQTLFKQARLFKFSIIITFAWGLPGDTRFDDLDLASRLEVWQNHKIQIGVDSCPP